MEPNKIICLHINGVMIPNKDLDGNYIKPQYMLCGTCNTVVERIDKII